ncbi:MAG: hypothetical protein SV765_07745 [Pseudomonadota bacterium]|nr:hypothetical protein [Pseudomonadales bacterium]MDY6920090.1 hypothetical protein [Pseudomonadota bacterium]
MSIEHKSIRYQIFFKSRDYEFDQSVDLDDETYEHAAPAEEIPEWCNLEYKKCPNCTLSPIWHPHCPLAVRLIPFVKLPACNSYDEVRAEVTMQNKTVIAETSAQEAFSSLLGLVMATSGCPHTRFFKPMAWYHQPFSTPEETMYRACTTYLFSNFIHKGKNKNKDFDFEALKRIYQNIHQINVHIAARIKNYSETDSALNAIVLLDLITNDLPIAVDEDLSELKKLFYSHRNLFN